MTQSSSGLSVLCWPLVRHYCIQSHHTGSACFSVCVYTCMCVSVYSLGPVMVEQASAYWGQVVEPWRLQSSSLDATHVWHLRAWPSQTEQERVPGLRLSMHIQKVAASMQVCNHLLISPFTHTHTHTEQSIQLLSPPTIWDWGTSAHTQRYLSMSNRQA